MKVNGRLSYKLPIIVDGDFLNDIDGIIKEYFDAPQYLAQLVNGDEVEFDYVSELILYDNYSERAIKTLRVSFGIGNYIRIEPTFSYINSYKYTLEMCFKVENNDRSEEIKRKIKTICDKHKQSALYTLASKFSFTHICILFWGVTFAINLHSLITDRIDVVALPISNVVAIIIIGIIVVFLLFGVLKIITKKLFPAIVFYLGENKKSIEKKTKIKSNIFWCVIVAGIVSAIVSLFFS